MPLLFRRKSQHAHRQWQSSAFVGQSRRRWLTRKRSAARTSSPVPTKPPSISAIWRGVSAGGCAPMPDKLPWWILAPDRRVPRHGGPRLSRPGEAAVRQARPDLAALSGDRRNRAKTLGSAVRLGAQHRSRRGFGGAGRGHCPRDLRQGRRRLPSAGGGRGTFRGVRRSGAGFFAGERRSDPLRRQIAGDRI